MPCRRGEYPVGPVRIATRSVTEAWDERLGHGENMYRLHRGSSSGLAVLVAVLAVAGCGQMPQPPGGDKPSEEKLTPGLPVVPGTTPTTPAAFTPTGRWETTEKLLLSAEDAAKLVAGSLRVSPDGRRWAFAKKLGETEYVWVVDGEPSAKFYSIEPANFIFSEDGKRTLYTGMVWEKQEYTYRVYLDGKLIEPTVWKYPVGYLQFTRDGKHYAFFTGHTVSGVKLRPMIDGKAVDTSKVGEYVSLNLYPGYDRFVWTSKAQEAPYTFTVEGKEVKEGGGFGTAPPEFRASKNGMNYAFLTSRPVVVNGVSHMKMGSIHLAYPLDGQAKSDVQLSDDGEHVLYAGESEGKQYVSFDNKWHELDATPLLPLTLSPDGAHWACFAGGSLWVDGKKGKEAYARSGELYKGDLLVEAGRPRITFSADGKQVAYSASTLVEESTRHVAFMVRDGHEQKRFTWVSNHAAFSPDGKHLAYFSADSIAAKGERFLTVDGERLGKGYSGFHDKVSATFSPDSRSVGFVAKKTGDLFAVLDGEEQKTYHEIGPEGTRVGFTTDGSYTFIAILGGASYWVEAKRK